MTFMLSDYIDNRILQASKSARKRQGRPSRGTPMPPGYGYLTHHPSAKSNSRSDKRFCYRRTSPDTRNKGKRNAALEHDNDMFGPRRPQKTYAHYRQTVLAGSDINRGSGSTLGIISTFDGIWHGLGRRHGRRISTSKEDVSTALGPSPPGSPPGTRPKQTA